MHGHSMHIKTLILKGELTWATDKRFQAIHLVVQHSDASVTLSSELTTHYYISPESSTVQ